MTKGWLKAMLLAAAIALPAAGTLAAAARAPAAIIAALHEALLATMKKGATQDAKARFDSLRPIVEETYDFERMVAIIAGPAWAQADAATRAQLVDAFRRFSVANYAARFKAYDGERFEILGERATAGDRLVLETRLIRSDGPPVSINYIFEQRDGRWQAIDVLAERAISELALRRSEYAATLREGGLPALTALLNERAAEMLRD
jgi:phospholipid transport system substrate-binding protein